MPGRVYSPGSYRFGMNGQMKDNEFTGQDGAHTTAQFWEYDSRIGRRWDRDPKPTIGISDYSCFANNPIWNSDPLGDWVKKEVTKYDKNGNKVKGIKKILGIGVVRKDISYTIHNAKLYNASGVHAENEADLMKQTATLMEEDVKATWDDKHVTVGKKQININVKFAEPIEVINSLDGVKSSGAMSDNLFLIMPKGGSSNCAGRRSAIGFASGNMQMMDFDISYYNLLLHGGDPKVMYRNKNGYEQTTSHELGHQLGFGGHDNTWNSIMYATPIYSTFQVLTAKVIRGLQTGTYNQSYSDEFFNALKFIK